MPATLFDEFWPYPEISGQLFLLVKGKRDRTALMKLIGDGDTESIEEWIDNTSPDDMVARLLRLGIPETDELYTPLFDEILLGTRRFEDGAGTVDYVLSRRVGQQFQHRVYNDGPGDVMYEFQTDRPMTKEEFDDLTTYPAPWEESGFDDEVADSSVWSVWDDAKRRRAKVSTPPAQTPEQMMEIVKRLQEEGRMPSFEQLQSALEQGAEEVAKQQVKKSRKKK
jgi:hypothetical protein